MTKLRQPPNGVTARATGAARAWSREFDPYGIVKLARDRSKSAILKLEKLMNGDAGKINVLSKSGETVLEVDIEVPAAVQAKCAELIIERGYGKSPQAILLTDPTDPNGTRKFSIAEKILAIQAARDNVGSTTDLEASEIGEPEVLEIETAPEGTQLVLAEATPAVPDPRDLI